MVRTNANIGAYGVEIKDTFISLNAYEIETGEMFLLTEKMYSATVKVYLRKSQGPIHHIKY